jgi:hypothetical protein
MTQPERPKRSTVGAAIDGWCAFWFAPQPAYTLGLVRIAFGLLVVAWSFALLPDLFSMLGQHGVAPQYPLDEFRWTVFAVWPQDTALLIGWVLLLVASMAMTVGWHGRIAAVTVFVLLYSFVRRGVYAFNAGETVMTIVALILALSSCSAALSLDQRRRSGSFWSAETLAQWPVRLMQVQMSLIYLMAVQAKLANLYWTNGSAVAYTWRTDGQWAFLAAPEWLSDSPLLVNVATWGTLVIEAALAILVWNGAFRVWVLAAGVVMHLSMMFTLDIGFFSLAMFVLYLAFVPPEVVHSLPERLKALRTRRSRAPSPQPDEQAAAT